MRGVILLLTIFSNMACAKIGQSIDEYTFVQLGGTFFSTPNVVSLKEIHLDNGTLLGREVVVEGTIVKKGEYTTHLVLADDTARMLVVLSHLPKAQAILDGKQVKTLRILGSVERGKKGLPLLMARAIVAPTQSKAN